MQLGDESELREVEEAPTVHPPVLGCAERDLQGVTETFVFVLSEQEALIFIQTVYVKK